MRAGATTPPILVGDHLYSKSFALMVDDGDPAVLDDAGARHRLDDRGRGVPARAQAQRHDHRGRLPADHHAEDGVVHLGLLPDRGRCSGGADAERLEALTRYGLDIGIAFQISDDSLDFVADEARLGKAIGADLREGKRTLPLIATLDRAEPAERERIQALLKSARARAGRDRGDPPLVVTSYEGVEYALERAHAYAQTAKDDLKPFADSEDKETLVLIADFVVDRDR